MRLKQVLNYLGDTEALLGTKATNRCSGVVIPPAVEEVTAPIEITSAAYGTYVDCAVLNSTDYVVVILNGISGSPTLGISGQVLRRGADGVVTEVTTVQTIAVGGSKVWSRPHVCMVTATKFVVVAQSTADDKIYAIVCTVAGSTITAQSPVDAGATSTLGVEAEIVRIDTDRVLLSYADNTVRSVLRVGTLTGVSIAFGTAVEASNYVIAQLSDLAVTDYPNQFYVMTRGTGGNYRNIKVTVAGNVVTAGAESGAINLYSGTTITALRRIAADMFASAATNITTGSEIVVNEYTTGTVKTTDGTVTANTASHSAGDLIGFGDDRFAYFFAHMVGSGLVAYEKFEYNGTSSITRHGTTVTIEAVDCDCIRASKNGFTATKFPVVYVDKGTNPSQFKIKTFIYEAGVSW